MKTKRLNEATRTCEGLRQNAQGSETSRLNNRLERREGKGTLNAGRTLWLAENKGLSKLTQIKFTLRAKCITKIRYLAARPLNVDEIKGEIHEESLVFCEKSACFSRFYDNQEYSTCTGGRPELCLIAWWFSRRGKRGQCLGSTKN
jgi:hypothetical protein